MRFSLVACALSTAACPSLAQSATVGPSAPRAAPAIATGGAPLRPEERPRYDFTPYGPGQPIEVTSSGRPVTVYVVKQPAGADRPLDEDFKRVGLTPVTFQLPPGRYLVETESPDTTRGSLVLDVASQPKHVLVRTGSDGVSTMGTLSIAVGLVALAAGVAVLVGGSTSSAGNEFDKKTFTIPLFVGGGVLLASGVVMFLVSRTDIEVQTPSERKTVSFAGAALRADCPTRAPGFVAGVRVAF